MSEFDIHFSDLNAKIIYHINPKNEIGISFLNIYNNFHLLIIDTLANTERSSDAELKNWGTNLHHQVKWNENITTNNSITLSDFSQTFVGSLINDTMVRETNLYKNTVKDFSFKTTTLFKLKNNDQFKLGYSLTHHDVY